MKALRISAAVASVIILSFLIFILGKLEPPQITEEKKEETGYICPENENIILSHAPGVYSEGFELLLKCANSEYTVCFTADCSFPTPLSDSEKISISPKENEATVIRAACFDKNGKQVGEAVSASYFITDKERFSTMIVSLVSDEKDLYGYENGILVNGKLWDESKNTLSEFQMSQKYLFGQFNWKMTGKEWERKTNVSFFDADGSILLSQNGGIRVQGGLMRHFSQKSLRIFARYEYSSKNEFKNVVFPNLSSSTATAVDEFKTLVLRNGGNQNNNDIIHNAVMMRLAEDAEVEAPKLRYACVFLNGKYYGLMCLMEDFSRDYIETHYGIPSEEVVIIGNSITPDEKILYKSDFEVDSGPESELDEFIKVRDYILRNNMANSQYYQIASEKLDMDSFIKYCCFESYCGNVDWINNNIRIWRRYTDGYNPSAEKYGYDGKWRFMVKDLDYSAGCDENCKANLSLFARLSISAQSLKLDSMFASLMKNADFRRKVYISYCELMDTTLSSERANEIISEISLSIAKELPYHLKEYELHEGSAAKWDKDVSYMREFFNLRKGFALKELCELTGSVESKVTFNVGDGGKLKLYSVSLENGNTDISYLKGLQVPLLAVADENYELDKITVTGGSFKDGILTIDSDSVSVSVTFKKKEKKAESIFISEVLFRHTQDDESYDWIEIYNPTDKRYNLKGWGIKVQYTENQKLKEKIWYFPAFILRPDTYVKVNCGVVNALLEDKYSLFFEKSLKPENTVVLITPEGKEVDSVYLEKIPRGYSLIKNSIESPFTYTSNATPEADNLLSQRQYDYCSTIPETLKNATVCCGSLNDGFTIKDGKITASADFYITSLQLSKDMKKSFLKAFPKAKANNIIDVMEALKVTQNRGGEYLESLNSFVIHRG